jgi:hypothetical protein
MAENKHYFRIKKGDVEIEYSGEPEEVNERYKEALEWVETSIIVTSPSTTATSKERQKVTALGPGRGGARSPIVSKGLDKIIAEGFLDKAKKTSEVHAELERKAVPGVTPFNVSEALKRKARQGVLDRIKGAGREYSYIKKEAEKKA